MIEHLDAVRARIAEIAGLFPPPPVATGGQPFSQALQAALPVGTAAWSPAADGRRASPPLLTSPLSFGEIRRHNADGPDLALVDPASVMPNRKTHQDFTALIERAAGKHGVAPALVRAVIRAESDFDPLSVSAAGAQGLMQLMPETARALGVTNPFDPAQNIDAGTRYLRHLLDQFGDTDLAVAAYNAGPGRVQRSGGIPPLAETKGYLDRVMSYLREYRGSAP